MATEDQLRDYLRRAAVDLTESRRRVEELEATAHEPIAVVGLSCRFPGGADNPDAYWDLLQQGRSGVVPVPPDRFDIDAIYDPARTTPGAVYTRDGALLDDISGWDAEHFGLSPREALRMDPAQRLLMELMHEAFEDGGIPAADLAGSRTAVLVGLMDTQQYGRLEVERYGAAVAGDPYFGQGVSPSVLAGRLAYHYDLHGPAVTIDTACSSSLVGVHLAVQALRRGECELAVAGGVFLVVTPDTYVQACATSQLTPDGRCKTFDRTADGYVIGEGAGLVLLERLSAAQRNGRRIHAVLHGSAVNQDGRSNGLTAPNRGAQVAVIRQALADARVAPDDIGYVEAHGSATALGDAIELGALHDVFAAGHADSPLQVGSVKTNIGHTQSAAGVAGLIKTVLAIQHGELPSSLNLVDPTDSLPPDGTIEPVGQNRPFPSGPARLAGVSAFGWSGTNAHVVVGPAPEPTATSPGPRPAYPLVVSASSATALRAQLDRLAEWTAARPEVDLGNLAHTLARGRTQHEFRCGVVGTDPADAAHQFGIAAPNGGRRPAGRPRVAFLLPGVGDEYAGLGAELYATEPVFAAAVDECLAVLTERCHVDLRPHLFRTASSAPDPTSDGDLAGVLRPDLASSDDPLRRAELAHSYLFTVEYALATLLAARGVRPDVIIGYSLGEYVGACLAGVFTLTDALHVIVERARLISGTSAGSMLAAVADEATVRGAIDRSGADVDIAALNGPSMTVVSGVASGIDALAARLRADGVAAMRLRTANAFHSSLLAPVRDKLAAVLDTVERHAPTIPLISNRTGEPLTAEEATTSEYWADHLISPVRFEQSVRHCLAAGIDTFVEVGAGQTLGGLLHRDLAPGPDIAVIGTLPNAPSAVTADPRHRESARLIAACLRLWELGVELDWDTMIPPGRVISTPTYAFQRTRYWPEVSALAPVPAAVDSAEPQDIGYTEAWHRDLTRRDLVPMSGHVVVFADDGVGEGLVAYALLERADVTLVRFGREYGETDGIVTIDRANAEDYRRLFRRVPEDEPVQIVYLRALHAADPDGAVTEGYDPLLRAVQACGDRPAGVRLLTVSRGGAAILGGDATAPQTTAAHGLGRVARHEYRHLTWQGVDLDPDDFDPVRVAGQLANELTHPADGSLSGWRRGHRWTPDWAPLTVRPDDDEPVWRADGTYLITGGARGLGRALARHLVRQGVRRLALVGRTASTQDVAEFTAADVDVLLLDADTARTGQLGDAFRRCREHFGALDGIVHAAGVPASGMLRRQTPELARAVIAPKLGALAAIAAELDRPDPPHLVVLYSSAITAFGAIGEGDYCAANTVLDAYGPALDARSGDRTRVLSIAWGPWQHDVWQSGDGGPVSELAARAGEYRRRYGFADDAGTAFLDALIRSAQGAVVAVRQPMEQAEREWRAMLDIDALVGASSAAPPGERFPRPDLRVEYVAPRGRLEQVVATTWEQFLGIDAVGVHDPFFDLGGNSLVGLAMLHALEHELAATIPPAVLFEHPTVAEIAAVLERSTTATAPGAVGSRLIDAGADRGQRRRRARTAGRKGQPS